MLGLVTINYLNWEDTLELIDTIEKQTFQKYHLVIIDNNSKNDSVQKISNSIKNKNNISFICSDENLGFAKGNNLGISYLLNRDIKKIMLLNNDTLLKDHCYLEKINSIKYKENVGAIGTKIIGSDGLNQNPILKEVNLKSFKKERKMVGKELNLQDNSILFFLFRIERFINRKLTLIKKKPSSFFLHGAAILLTENYFNYFNGLFPKTFLYFEEDILALLFQKFNLEFLYDDSLEIFHKEDQSSNIAWSGDSKPKLEFLKNSIDYAIEIQGENREEILRIVNESEKIFKSNYY